MHFDKSRRTMFAVVAACVTTSALTTPPLTGAGQGERVTRPVVAEKASPLEPIAPVAHDGYRGQAFLRKPPGEGPFPAVVLIHGGLTTVPSERLREYVVTNALPSRFLAAGYVVATITYRSRDVDPQSRVSMDDSVAAVEYLQHLPYVNAASVGIFGCSGGGDLALAVAAEKPVAAIVAEEPASILFTGVFNSASPRAGERYTPGDSSPIFEDPKRYYTEERQRLTREKIARIQSPILIVQGEVIAYAGEPHCFAMRSPPASAASALKAFRDSDEFFRRFFATQPKPIDPALVTDMPLMSK
jgi:dipeptidyl aminopeptidase/acylaminoacyl peptidase